MTNETKAHSGKGKGKIWFGVIIVVIAAVVIVSITSFPPEDENIQGAIGAADKYRAEQISDADVTLNETEIQKLLQDDQILALLENKELMNAISKADNEIFQAITIFGPDLALAMKEEAAGVLEMMSNATPAEFEAMRNSIPAFIDGVNYSPIDDGKRLMGIIREAKTSTFKALVDAPDVMFKALRTGSRENALNACQDASPAVIDAITAVKNETYKAFSEVSEKAFKAMSDAHPADLQTLKNMATPTFKAFVDAKAETMLALRGIKFDLLEARRDAIPAQLAALQKANPVLMVSLQKVNPMFAQALAANPEFKKEMLQRANVNFE